MYADFSRQTLLDSWPEGEREKKLLLKARNRGVGPRSLVNELRYVGSLNWLSRALYLRCEMGLPGEYAVEFIGPLQVQELEAAQNSAISETWLVDRYKYLRTHHHTRGSAVFKGQHRHHHVKQRISLGVHLPVIPIAHDLFASSPGYEKEELDHPMFFSEKHHKTHGVLAPGHEDYPSLFKLLHQPNFCRLLSFAHYIYEWAINRNIEDIGQETLHSIAESKIQASPRRKTNHLGLATLGEAVHQFEVDLNRREQQMKHDLDVYTSSLEGMHIDQIDNAREKWLDQRRHDFFAHHAFPNIESLVTLFLRDEQRVYELLVRYTVIVHKIFRAARRYNHCGPSTKRFSSYDDAEKREKHNSIERTYHMNAWPMWIYKFPFTEMKEHFYTLFASLHPYYAKSTRFVRRKDLRKYFTCSEMEYLCSAVEVTKGNLPEFVPGHVYDPKENRRVKTLVLKIPKEVPRGYYALPRARLYMGYNQDQAGTERSKLSNYLTWLLYTYDGSLIPRHIDPNLRRAMQGEQAKMRIAVQRFDEGMSFAEKPLSEDDARVLKEIFDTFIGPALPSVTLKTFKEWIPLAIDNRVDFSLQEFVDLNDEDQWMSYAGKFISTVSQRSFA